MYYLNFLKWFWTKHLSETSDKVIFCIAVWAAGIVIAIIFAISLQTPQIVFGYFIFSVSCAILAAFAAGIMYMRDRYIEWQMQVVKALKGK